MKKLAIILLAVIGVTLGTNLTASAADGYPPGTQITITAPTAANPVAPGAAVPIAINNVPPNTNVTVTFNGVTKTVNSGPNGGTVKFDGFVAPATAGSVPVTVAVGSATVNGTVVVAAGGTGGGGVTITAPTGANPVAPGAAVPIAINNVPPNTNVTVTFNGVTKTVNSGPNGGTVKIDGFVAPATAGSYPVSVLVGTSTTPVTGTVAVSAGAVTTTTTTTVKPGSTVPVTGSNAPFTGIAIGIPLLVGGLVLLVVSRRRRPVGA